MIKLDRLVNWYAHVACCYIAAMIASAGLTGCATPTSMLDRVDIYYTSWTRTSDVRLTAPLLIRDRSTQHLVIDDPTYCRDLRRFALRLNANPRVDIPRIGTRLVLLLRRQDSTFDTISFNRFHVQYNESAHALDTAFLMAAIRYLPEGYQQVVTLDIAPDGQ